MGKFGEIDSADTRAGKFPLVPMGVLAPISVHTGPSAQPPIVTSGVDFTKFTHFPVKIGLIEGVGGIPQISFSLDS